MSEMTDLIEAAAHAWHANRTPETLHALRVACIPWFERLAEHHAAQWRPEIPVAELVAVAQRYLPYYARRWNPLKGKLWTFLTICTKGRFDQCSWWEREASAPERRYP